MLNDLLCVNEFNLKCAKYLGVFYSNSNDVFVEWPKEGMPRVFNPYYDANDRNKVIENMLIDTDYDNGNKEWVCCKVAEINNEAISTCVVIDSSMENAQVKCIEAVLNT